MHKKITAQQARDILKSEGLDVNDPYSRMSEKCRCFLLKTGAKLSYNQGRGWSIHGYAYDGSDVLPYCQ